jgi:ATP-binding cassette, subfamily C (CFTR/MRP), member 1
LILNEKGQFKQQGPVRALSQSLKLSSSPQTSKPEIQQTAENLPQTSNLLTDQDIKLDATRQLGDSAMYMFYARGAGWLSLVIFCIAMLVEAFCDSFPSKLFRCDWKLY